MKKDLVEEVGEKTWRPFLIQLGGAGRLLGG